MGTLCTTLLHLSSTVQLILERKFPLTYILSATGMQTNFYYFCTLILSTYIATIYVASVATCQYRIAGNN